MPKRRDKSEPPGSSAAGTIMLLFAVVFAAFPVSVLASDAVSGGELKEYNQLLHITYPAAESTIQLSQVRILIEVTSATAGASRVLQVIMTCPTEIFSEAGKEFQRFVSTISPAV
jgi:hypothetical protein